MARPSAVSMFYLALALSGACGDDEADAGDGPVVSTGLPRGAQLSSLDDGDAQAACESLGKSFEAAIGTPLTERALCTLSGITRSFGATASGDPDAAVDSCQEASAKCLAKEAGFAATISIEIGPDAASCAEERVDARFATCDATVAEFERCVSAVASAWQQQLAGISCEWLRDLDQLKSYDEPEPASLPGCAAFVEKCPDVDLGAGDDAGDDDPFEDEA